MGERLSGAVFNVYKNYTTFFRRVQYIFKYFKKNPVFEGIERSFGPKGADFALSRIKESGDSRPQATAPGFQAGWGEERGMDDLRRAPPAHVPGLFFHVLSSFLRYLRGKCIVILRVKHGKGRF
jgi:hypothetical protein